MNNKSEKSAEKPMKPRNFYLISFIEGGAVMAVEIIGAKMIAPYFGNSLYVWAAVLAVTLAGLSIGYFSGGYVSKKYKKPSVLFIVIAISAVLVAIMPGWGSLMMEQLLSLELRTATLLSASLFLLPPLVCFGMVSPLIIDKVSKLEEGEAGKVSGTVYAVSTVGGILATLITGFYMIPELGLKTSAFIYAVILLLIPGWFVITNGNLGKFAVILSLISTCVVKMDVYMPETKVGSHLSVVHMSDGLMGQMLIMDDAVKQCRSLNVNNISQTFMHVPTKRSQWKYVHRLAKYASVKPAGSDVLLCGLAGGNVVNELMGRGFNVDAVELDARMDYLARNYFSMNPGVVSYVDDARHFINVCEKQYDVIILDMSAGENQPTNVYTLESFKKLKAMLKPDGMMFIHYLNTIEGEYAMAVKSIGRTLQEAGLVPNLIDTQLAPEQAGERMFVCSVEPIDWSNEQFERRDRFADPFNFPSGSEVFIADYNFSDGYVLVDDRPIMDFLHENVLESTRKPAMEFTIPTLLKQDLQII